MYTFNIILKLFSVVSSLFQLLRISTESADDSILRTKMSLQGFSCIESFEG